MGSYQRGSSVHRRKDSWISTVSVSHKGGFWQKIRTRKSSFPLRVIKAQSSLFPDTLKSKSVSPTSSLLLPHSPPLCSIEDQIGCSVFLQIQYARAGSQWATGVGDNTYRRWILRRPGRRAQSRAQPHMGTLPWLSCWWHWKMKAISELAELWGGLLHSSIWARGLLVHSLTSLKQQKWARLENKQKVLREELGYTTLTCIVVSPFWTVKKTKNTPMRVWLCTVRHSKDVALVLLLATPQKRQAYVRSEP